jgi:hypothetical protein
MLRWKLALFVVLVCISSATASVERRLPQTMEKDIPLKFLRSLPTTAANDDFRITAATEVLLDGRPCPYQRIPNHATIILLETMTNESKEIARIHFRSGSSVSPASKKP